LTDGEAHDVASERFDASRTVPGRGGRDHNPPAGLIFNRCFFPWSQTLCCRAQPLAAAARSQDGFCLRQKRSASTIEVVQMLIVAQQHRIHWANRLGTDGRVGRLFSVTRRAWY
jgi:hypothetical protein